LRQQRTGELFAIDPRRARLEHEAHRGVPAGFVVHRVEHRQHQLLRLLLFRRQCLLPA
jgi:hypothetical protein